MRLHFERFEKLVISQFFTLQKFFFFQKRVLYFIIFRKGNTEWHYLKRKKKKRENCKSVLFAKSEHHDVSIVCQAQASLGVS